MQRAGVQHVVLLQPATASLANAEAEIVEVQHTVRIRIDADQDAFFFGELTVGVEQIHALGVRVEFQKAAALTGLADDPRHVHVIRLTLLNQPARRVGQDVKVRPVHRAQDAFGLLLTREVQAAMHGADHQIQPAQNVVRQIQLPVLQNVDLDPFEQRNTGELRVQAIDLVNFRQQARRIKTTRHRDMFRVFGDSKVRKAALAGGQGHLVQAIPPIRSLRMGVQITFEIIQFYQLWQRACLRGFDLTPVFSQFWRDEGQTDSLKNRLLGLAGDAPVALEDPVFVDLET
jgi:hypothetical protein